MIDKHAKLADRLNQSQLSRNEPLSQYTTFRIGGPADLFYSTSTDDELAMAVLAARELQIPYFVLGLGANILVGDKGFRGLVIRNHAGHFTFSDKTTRISAFFATNSTRASSRAEARSSAARTVRLRCSPSRRQSVNDPAPCHG